MFRISNVIFFCFLLFSFESRAQQKLWSLQDCMRYAVEHSPRKNIQDIYNENEALNKRDAILDFLPGVSANIGAGLSFGRSIDPDNNSYTNTTYLNNSYSVSAGMNVFNGFRAINRLKIAKISQLMGYEESERIQDDISLSTIQAYFNVIYYMGMVKLSEEQLAASSQNLHGVKVREGLGLKGDAEVKQAEAEMASNELNKLRTQNQLNNSLITLKQTMYYPLDDTLKIDTAIRWDQNLVRSTESPDSVYRTALAFLPAVKISQFNIDQARLNLRSNRGALFPNISMSGGYGTGYSTGLGDSRGAGVPSYGWQFRNKGGQNFSVGMGIPIFSGLQRRSNIRRSKNTLRINKISYEQNLREIEIAVERAIQDMEGAAKEYEQADRQAYAEEIAYTANQKRFNEGLISILELQTSSGRLLRAKTERLNALFEYLLKRKVVNYYKGIPYLEDL